MATEHSSPGAETKFTVSRSTMFPLVGGRTAWSHEHLLPIFVTLIVGMALFAVPFPWPNLIIDGTPAPAEINEAWQVFSILALYIAFVVTYYINQMCGRAKGGWLLAIVAACTFLLLSSPFWNYWYLFFYNVIPGTELQKSSNIAANIAGYVFGTGLCEEGLKALPLFGFALLGGAIGAISRHAGGKLRTGLAAVRRHIGLCGPLDGIVMGVASGCGFFVRETLGQYVPEAMNHVKYPAAKAFDGLVLLLARGLPDLAEHSAWCGLFGYFIGLAALQPRMAIVLIAIGWSSAAALHGAWDAISSGIGSQVISVSLLIVDGLLSYALLAGAIFKAREISLGSVVEFAPAGAGGAGPAMAAAVAAAPLSIVDDSG